MRTYLVGGAVRDQLMGRVPKDRDWVIVGATQADVEGLLASGYSQVGADFPVFLHPTTGEEHALARRERKTGRGYHGFTVEADASVTIEEDLARRDLTINAMALDGDLIDPYGGQVDLHNRVLRHTSPAFVEDPLRVLRLARFAGRYSDFTIAPETVALCQALCATGELNHLAVERIWVELDKGLSGSAPGRFMEALEALGALSGSSLLQPLFGPTLAPWQRDVATRLAKVPVDMRLVVGVAAMALSAAVPDAAWTPVARALLNQQACLTAPRTCEGLLAVLKRAKALHKDQSAEFVDLLTTVSISGRGAFTTRQLMAGRLAVRGIDASMFPEVPPGPALGAAIDDRRLHALVLATNLPRA